MMVGEYYVYRLIDPRNDETFYIGKGKGKRVESHERRVRLGKETNPAKAQKIREIWQSGHEVKREIVGRFALEADAYNAEAELIDKERPSTNLARCSRRVVSFMSLAFEAIYKRDNNLARRLAQIFPRHRLPMEAHRQLFDIATLRLVKQ
jgi:hypothetical protein